MIVHTPGEMCVTAHTDGFNVVPAGQPRVIEADGNANLIRTAHTAPHECSDSQCPGNVNRRKLAAIDGLLAATQKTTVWLLDCAARNDEEAQSARVGYFPKLTEAYNADAESYRAVAVELQAAIAQAQKTTAPAAEALGAGPNLEVRPIGS